MTKTFIGTCESITKQNPTSGKTASSVEIKIRGEWDPTEKKFGPDSTVSIWFFDSEKAKSATWLLERQALIGKTVVCAARESTKDGKTAYFGRYLPISYGMMSLPAEIREGVSPEEQMAAATALEDCQDAGELAPDIEPDFTSAASIASVISILSASTSTVAKEAVVALRKLIWSESTVYIGKIGYAARSGSVFKVSFVTPKSEPAEWNSVSFFRDLADRAEKVLKKGDNVVLMLAEKGEFNGQPSYVGRNFRKLA